MPRYKIVLRGTRRKIRVAVYGYGFMAKLHIRALLQAAQVFNLQVDFEFVVVCSRNEEKGRAFASQWGIPNWTNDAELVAQDPDIDLHLVCLPNNLHQTVALAIASTQGADKRFMMLEKPIARNAAEGSEIVATVDKSGLQTAVNFSYRRYAAVVLAKQGIDEGRLGTPTHYRGTFDQGWTLDPDLPQGDAGGIWRLDANISGSGVTGDLESHSLDLAEWLNGPIVAVQALSKTMYPTRTDVGSSAKVATNIEDAIAYTVLFANGAIGTFESTRLRHGRRAYMTFEASGTNGAFTWGLEHGEDLNYAARVFGEEKTDPRFGGGFSNIHATEFDHPYGKVNWVPGLAEGYGHTAVALYGDWFTQVAGGTPVTEIATVHTAQRIAVVCDAVLKSAKTGNRVEIK